MIVRPGFEQALVDEFRDRFQVQGRIIGRAAVGFGESAKLPNVSDSVFARQLMPRAQRIDEPQDEKVADLIFSRLKVLSSRDNRGDRHWTIHAFAVDDDVGLARAKRIKKRLMSRVELELKHLHKYYAEHQDFIAVSQSTPSFIVQIFSPEGETAWFSVATINDGISVFEGGFRRMKQVRGAPSRSASKLEEALSIMDIRPEPGHIAVDLGAAPGGWTLVLARHGAHVMAVDHGKLDITSDVETKSRIEWIPANGLKFVPPSPVDWLVCDMVMSSRDTMSVLRRWMEEGWMRLFVVNLKLPKANQWPAVKEALEIAGLFRWPMVKAKHLIHDRNEVTLMGWRDKT